MIINMDRVKLVLMKKDIPANFLERQTGVSRSAITRVRNGERKIENLTLETIIKIQSWIDSENTIQNWWTNMNKFWHSGMIDKKVIENRKQEEYINKLHSTILELKNEKHPDMMDFMDLIDWYLEPQDIDQKEYIMEDFVNRVFQIKES